MELNLAAVRGTLSSVPEIRLLPSGASVATLAVRAPAADGRSTSVPVTVWDPPAWVATLELSAEVLVVGRVRRRFYRAGAATGSRVDLEATWIGRPDRRGERSWARRIEGALDGLVAGTE